MALSEGHWGPRQIDQPTKALTEHQASIPTDHWGELLDHIQKLPNKPAPLFESYTLSTNIDIVHEQRELVRLSAERIRVCPVDDLPIAISAALRGCRLTQSQTLIQQLVEFSCLAVACSAISSRRSDISNSPHVEIICQTINVAAQHLWDARLGTWRGETVVLFSLYHDIGNLSTYVPPPPVRAWWQPPLLAFKRAFGLVVYRLNRERALRFAVEFEISVRDARDEYDLMAKIKMVPEPIPFLPRLVDWTEINPFPIVAANHMVTAGLAKAMLQMAVIEADLKQKPLPLDPFSTPPALLKPIERNGRTVGWYSVGPNGVDDGGMNNKDFGMPILESLGQPKFSDVPKPRP